MMHSVEALIFRVIGSQLIREIAFLHSHDEGPRNNELCISITYLWVHELLLLSTALGRSDRIRFYVSHGLMKEFSWPA